MMKRFNKITDANGRRTYQAEDGSEITTEVLATWKDDGTEGRSDGRITYGGTLADGTKIYLLGNLVTGTAEPDAVFAEKS